MRRVRKALNFRFSDRELEQLDSLVRHFNEKFRGAYPPRESNRTDAIRILIRDKIADLERVERDRQSAQAAKMLKETRDKANHIAKEVRKQGGEISTLAEINGKRIRKPKGVKP